MRIPSPSGNESRRGHGRRVRLALIGLIVFGSLRLLVSFCEFTPWIPKVDFNARYNEVLCLRAGYDPYDVFTDKVSIPCVVSMADLPSIADVPLMQRLPSFPDFGKEGQKEMAIHAYPPWSYAWLLPWTFVSRDVAWLVHLALELASLAVLFLVPCRYLSRFESAGMLRLAFFAAALNLGKVIPATLMCGNYSTFVAAGALGLCVSLDRDRQIPAGLCLALMMLKPQIGAIFVVPLLLGRRFVSVAVGAALCLAGAFWASSFCDSSVLDMIRNANAAGPVFFNGTALLPTRLLRDVWPNASPSVLVPLCAAFGASVCTVASWRARKCGPWIERLAPAALCSLFWMVSRTYDYAMLALPLAVLVPLLFRVRPGVPPRLRLAILILSPFLFLRNFNPVVGNKVRFLAARVSDGFGVDILPLFDVRTVVASWCWYYQPWFLVPLALLLAETLRHVAREKSPANGPCTGIAPELHLC